MTDAEAWEALEAWESNPTPETWEAAKAASKSMPCEFFDERFVRWAHRVMKLIEEFAP